MSRLSRQLLKVTTPPWIGILDRLVAISAGAWSLRRLRGGYAGPCLNVRRDSDNATLDIGFTRSGDLNVTQLLNFAGSGNAYVTAFYDQSGNNSHLQQGSSASQPQIVNAGALVTIPTAGRAGISTNGASTNAQYLATNATAPLNLPQPFTRSSVVSFPVTPTTSPGNPILLFSGGGPNNQWVELYATATGQFTMYVNGGFVAINGVAAGMSGNILETFNFNNSACTFNSQKATGSVGATGVGCQLMEIGGYNGTRGMQANYGELILFSEVLPAADQQNLITDQCNYWQTPSPYRAVVLADAPYAYWPLNETSGTLAADISGNGRNGSYQAGAQLGKGTLLPGMSSAYVGLSGAANAYVDVSAATQFCAGSAWSAECWTNVSAYTVSGSDGSHGTPWGTNTGVRFLGNQTWTGGSGSASGIDWGIEAVASGSASYNVILWPASYQNVQSGTNTAPASGTANHHVVTYSNGTYSLYLNGALLASASKGDVTIQSGLQIGSAGWTCGAFDGVIGEVALYASALTPQQVAAHYASGVASRIGLLDGLTTPVVAAWSLRRLRGGYTGPCLNVRRDSDNAAKDIGFTATGDLDIAGLLAFVGAANGFVTTLYDQTANASNSSNLARTTTTQQPQIVTNGALNIASTGSARPAVLATGTASSFQNLLANATKLTINQQPFSRASVTGIPTGATSSSFTVMTGSVNYSIIALNAVNLKYQMYDYNVGFTSSNSVTAGAINSVTENYNTTASSIVVNGTSTSGSIGSGGDGTQLCIAGVLTEVAGASATLCEVIQFGALLTSTDQAALYASQKGYWGTP